MADARQEPTPEGLLRTAQQPDAKPADLRPSGSASASSSKSQPEATAAEVLDDVDAPELRRVARHLAAYYREEVTGPMPPPKMLRDYEDLLPGSAERFWKMAEREQAHRHANVDKAIELEKSLSKAAARESLIGQVAAFIIAMTAIVGGIVLIGLDKSVGGIATIIGALVALTTAFLVNRLAASSRARDRAPEGNGNDTETNS